MISIIIPVLDEADNLSSLIPDIYARLSDLDIQVILVDGGSTDGTVDIVRDLSSRYSSLVFSLQSKNGFANALVEGIRSSKGSVIVTMDAENHEPDEVSNMVNMVESGFDVVIASRFNEESHVDLQANRFLMSGIANSFSRLLFRLPIKDTSSGFRAYNGESLRKVVSKDHTTRYFAIQVELLFRIVQSGGRVCEVPMHYKKRDKGSSKFSFIPALIDAIRLVRIALLD